MEHALALRGGQSVLVRRAWLARGALGGAEGAGEALDGHLLLVRHAGTGVGVAVGKLVPGHGLRVEQELGRELHDVESALGYGLGGEGDSLGGLPGGVRAASERADEGEEEDGVLHRRIPCDVGPRVVAQI